MSITVAQLVALQNRLVEAFLTAKREGRSIVDITIKPEGDGWGVHVTSEPIPSYSTH